MWQSFAAIGRGSSEIWRRKKKKKTSRAFYKSSRYSVRAAQLSATLIKLCHIKRDHSVHTTCSKCPPSVDSKRTLAFSDILPKQLGIFSPSFTRLLVVHIYARVQIFVQLPPTVTKLCHIKCDHPACVSVDGGHFEHIMVIAIIACFTLLVIAPGA